MKGQVSNNLSETDLATRIRRLEHHTLSGKTPRELSFPEGLLEMESFEEDLKEWVLNKDYVDEDDADNLVEDLKDWVVQQQYVDAEEAADAAPVQSVNGQDGDVEIDAEAESLKHNDAYSGGYAAGDSE